MEVKTGLRPYPSYRPTNLPWLAQIPAHWEVTKVKRGYEIRLGKMLRPESLTPSDTLEPYLRAANIQWQDVDTNDVKEMWFSQWEKPLYELRDGDLMVCEGGDVGRAAIWQGQLEKCYIQNSVHRVRNREGFTNKFLYYWLVTLKNKGYIDLLCNKATIAHFTADKFAAIELIAPPLPEQQTIAAYLDRQTAKIDALIAKKQRLLDLLAEQRAALISRAVTKGLNPNVEMKDSGVAWMGQVPRHWEVLHLRRVINKFVDYRGHTPPKVDDGIPLITARNIKHGRIDWEFSQEYIPEKLYEEWMVRGFPEIGDVLVTTEAPLGETAQITTTQIALAQRIILLKADKTKIENDYLKYFLASTAGQGELWSRATGSTAIGIKASHLKEMIILVPPIDEQTEITKVIEKEEKKIFALIAKVETAIARLREYRAALISSAVTGKIMLKHQ